MSTSVTPSTSSAPSGPGGTPPPVDVVIATRNRPEMVREALAAVAGQTYPGPVRCLVVHDGTDPDDDLVSHDPHRPVEVLANRRTPGLAGARNTGVLGGRSPYVAFCDDDDLWDPAKVDLQVRHLEERAVRTVVTGVTVRYGDTEVVRVPRAEDLGTAMLVRRRVMAAHPSTVLVRRHALRYEIGLFDEQIPGSYGEDYDWILRAVSAGSVGVVERALVDVRWGASQFAREWLTIVEALDYLVSKHPAFESDARGLGRVRGQQAFAEAALRRGRARRAILRSLHLAPTEPRAYLAALVALRVVRPEAVLDRVNRHGRGI